MLYNGALRVSDPDDLDRDRMILSKGHAALALYAALHLCGWLTAADLDTYCGEGSLLGVHPESALRGVDFCSGSLGQGLSLGTGAALAGRLQGSQRRAFVLLSDAECNEGSVWEAVMFASHHQLANLVVVLDLNGQQALGTPATSWICRRSLNAGGRLAGTSTKLMVMTLLRWSASSTSLTRTAAVPTC